jgi:hypothetical protein
MFLTGHLMIAFIIYKLFNLKANLFLFLFFSILPDVSWPFYTNHRKESWYHTVLFFTWTLFFPPYCLAVLSHFIADFFAGGIRLTPWNKKRVGIIFEDEKRVLKSKFFISRMFNHVINNFKKRKYLFFIEIFLLIICLLFIFY